MGKKIEPKKPEKEAEVPAVAKPTTKGVPEPKTEATTKTSKPEGKKGETGEKTLTQEQIDKLVGNVRKSARETVLKDILKDLGVDSLESAKTALESLTNLEREKLSEQERLETDLKAAQQKNLELEKGKTDLEATALEAQIKAAIVDKAAEKFASGEATFRLINRSLINVDENGDVQGVEEALTAIAEKYPFLLRGKGKSVTSPANPKSDDAPKSTDAERHTRYFGARQSEFWDGAGMQVLTQSKKE